ncbi:MAG: aldo/keto reductase [Acidobacteria bacterium]|nr:aldo/keto reductase [Acidobacteriota bacterium]
MTETSRRNFLLTGLALPVALESATSSSFTVQQPNTPIKLTYRDLGKTGLKPTIVGFGCMITSDQSVVERAADLGINYFDTARGYQGGNNERMVGAALKSKRKNLIISTKTMSRTKEEALQHIDASLKELGTDYVDIWHLHMKNRPEDLTDGLLEAQQIAKQAGKARFLGVSTHDFPRLLPALLDKAPHFDVVLSMYNFTMSPDLTAAFESAAKAGLGTIAMKVMAGGAGMGRGKPNPIMQREGALLSALKWVLKNPNVHTAIPSITDMEQLDENIRACSETFTGADEKILAAHLESIRPLYCRTCGACTGKCAQGIPVAEVLRFLSYSEGYGQFQLARENYLSLPSEIRNARCDACTECTIQCPNGVQVARRVRRAQELLA